MLVLRGDEVVLRRDQVVRAPVEERAAAKERLSTQKDRPLPLNALASIEKDRDASWNEDVIDRNVFGRHEREIVRREDGVVRPANGDGGGEDGGDGAETEPRSREDEVEGDPTAVEVTRIDLGARGCTPVKQRPI